MPLTEADFDCSYANGGRGCRLLGRFELWSPTGPGPDRLACPGHLADQIDMMHRVMERVIVCPARYIQARTAEQARASQDAPAVEGS